MYRFHSLYCMAVDDKRFYRVVFRKDGRQKMARAVFAESRDALVYAMRIEKRLDGLEMARIKSSAWWFVGFGAHVFVMLLGLTAWWLLVGR